jgi:drug/metabolite transporter superfamily protein YnfA
MKKVLPPTYFLAAIVLMGAFHFVLPLRQVIPFPWRLLGVVPLLLGVFLNLLADHAFKRYHDHGGRPIGEEPVAFARCHGPLALIPLSHGCEMPCG